MRYTNEVEERSCGLTYWEPSVTRGMWAVPAGLGLHRVTAGAAAAAAAAAGSSAGAQLRRVAPICTIVTDDNDEGAPSSASAPPLHPLSLPPYQCPHAARLSRLQQLIAHFGSGCKLPLLSPPSSLLLLPPPSPPSQFLYVVHSAPVATARCLRVAHTVRGRQRSAPASARRSSGEMSPQGARETRARTHFRTVGSRARTHTCAFIVASHSF